MGNPAVYAMPFEMGAGTQPAAAPDNLMRLMTAAGTTLAVGDAAHLSRLAWSAFAGIPKGHPVLLVVAGATLAFATAAALVEHLVAMAGDRNAGLPGPLRAYSSRARTRIGANDRATSEHLDPNEWRAHHLIGVHGAKYYTALLTSAAQAGWRMDSEGNTMVLPRTRAAQAKLAAQGMHLPLHDNAHPKWNGDLIAALQIIEDRLDALELPRGSPAYSKAAKRELDELQSELRGKALKLDRITQLEQNSVG